MRWFAPTAALGLLCAVSVLAQQPQDPVTPQQPLIFRAGIDVVQFEFNAFDKNRLPIHGLTKDKIQIFEDGKLQEIVDLREITIDEGDQAPVWAHVVKPDVVTNDTSDRRLIGLIVDDLMCCSIMGTSTTDRVEAGDLRMAAEYIIDHLGPRDMATVILTHEMAANQPFTGDRDVLRNVMTRFQPGTDNGCFPQPPYPTFTGDLRRMFAASSQPVKAIIELHSANGVGSMIRDQPCALRSYVVPDIGRRVTVSQPTARASGDTMSEREELSLPPVPVYRIVTGHNVMPRYPFRMGPPPPQRPEDVPLDESIDDTLARIFSQNGSYYLLGFRTSKPTTDGNYRRLEVKIPGQKDKDYTIRARAGYMRPKATPKPGSGADRNPELPRLPTTVSTLLPASDINLKAAVAAFAMPGTRKHALLVSLELAHPIEGDIASGFEEIDLRTVVYESGNTKQDTTSRVKLNVENGIHRVAGAFPMRLDVDPDHYELWLTARDPRTTRLGGLFYDIEIPDRVGQAVTLSNVLLGREPSAGNPVPPMFADLIPIVPVTARTFGTFDSIQAFFQISQGTAAPLSAVALAIRVLDDQGKTKFTKDETLAPERFTADRFMNYQLKLPLEELKEGRYLLTIEARLGGRISPKRDLMFVVR